MKNSLLVAVRVVYSWPVTGIRLVYGFRQAGCRPCKGFISVLVCAGQRYKVKYKTHVRRSAVAINVIALAYKKKYHRYL